MTNDKLFRSIRRYINPLVANAGDVENKYGELLAFLNKQCPDPLWEELRQVQPAKDVLALRKWGIRLKPESLQDARRIALHLTHPAGNEYAMECCYYTADSFDKPRHVRQVKSFAIADLQQFKKCGRIIGIDQDDAPTLAVELADRYVPFVYAVLILADWLAGEVDWLGGKTLQVYVINFGVETIHLGSLREGVFCGNRKIL